MPAAHIGRHDRNTRPGGMQQWNHIQRHIVTQELTVIAVADSVHVYEEYTDTSNGLNFELGQWWTSPVGVLGKDSQEA